MKIKTFITDICLDIHYSPDSRNVFLITISTTIIDDILIDSQPFERPVNDKSLFKNVVILPLQTSK